MTTSPRQRDIALLVGRVPLGLYFLLAGWNKLAGTGVGAFVSANLKNVPGWAEVIGRPYLSALPFVEILAGLLVLLGLFVRVSAAVMAMMLLSFLIAQVGPVYIARVYGTTPGVPFDRNLLLLSLAIILALLGGGSYGIDRFVGRRRSRGALAGSSTR